MVCETYMPPASMMLRLLRIDRERLDAPGRIAVDLPLLRKILRAAVAGLPFDAAFYRASYPELAAAHALGTIADLHAHFVEHGYFEGRLGYPPAVDEAWYADAYPDVAAAVAAGRVASGAEHYLRAGGAEGRAPNEATRPSVAAWAALRHEYPAS